MDESVGLVRVWDLPTRLFHWGLAACVLGSVVSAKLGGNAMAWHFRFGYVVFALLVFRLIWGVVGGRWSRFSSFVRGPGAILSYLRGPVAPLQVGHNPTGALSVLALLAVLAAQVGTGLFADDEIANSGPLVRLVSGATSSLSTSWHKTFGQWLVYVLVGLHIAAILFYLLKKKQNLIGPMVSGNQRLPLQTVASADGWQQRVLAVAVLCGCAALVAWVLQWGRWPVAESPGIEPKRAQAPRIEMLRADSVELLEEARRIFRDYAASLAVDLCFQNFDAELRELPGDYRLPAGQLLLALVDGVVAGCAAMRPLPDCDYPNACEMKRLYVRPAFRGFGLGRLLVQALLDDAKQAAYSAVLLDTLDDMEAARGLYASFGFEEIPPYYFNPIPGAHYLKADIG